MRPSGSLPSVALRNALSVLAFAGLLLAAAPAARAQTNMGPSKCVGCHDHEKQARKWQKEEPAAFKGKAHYNTLKQLDAPKSAQWAKAVGLADPYDVKGSCVKCHATVFRGDANAGVSCESCHGPSSKYNDLHQQKGSYAQSVAAGLIDLKEKPAIIGKVCADCHFLRDSKLAAAGHPTGAEFDAGAGLQKLVHWDTAYNYAAITAAAKAAGGGRAVAAAAPAAAAPAAKAPAAAPPGKAAAPPAAGPAAKAPPEAAPAAAAPAPKAAKAPAAAPPPPGPPPAPWDWDQPVRPLPDDYVPEAEAEPEAAPAPEAAAPAPAPPRRRRAEPAPAPVVPPSLAEEAPLPDALPGAAVVTSAAADKPPAGPRPPAADAVALRGEAVLLLEKLLRGGARTPNAPDPAKPAEYSGPDSELLRLQDEVLALALEALRRPQ